MQSLRPYQQQAITRLRAAFTAGKRRAILVAPTGSGKTTVISEMIRLAVARGGRVLCLAHRRELIGQLSDRLTSHGVPHHGVIMAGVPSAVAPVQVASIQTAVRREFPEASFIVIDECHHVTLNSAYRRVLDHYQTAPVVGLTATPTRLDGKGLGDVFDALVVAATPQELLRDGFLAPLTGKAFARPDGLDAVHTVAGDYDVGELATIYERPKILGDIVSAWQRFAGGRRTIAFVPSIDASRALCERIPGAEHLDYRASRAERDAILRRVRSGQTRFVSNVALLGEGIDIPELEVCVLARPTKSLSLYLQCVGRVTRPAAGKAGAYLLDHGACAERFGHPYADREWSLETTKPKIAGPGTLRTCPHCLAILDGSPSVCPECGAELRSQRVEAEVETDVIARDIDLSREGFEQILLRHLRKGHQPGAAIHEWKRVAGIEASVPWGIWRKYVGKGKGATWLER